MNDVFGPQNYFRVGLNGRMGDGTDSCDPCLRLCEPDRFCRTEFPLHPTKKVSSWTNFNNSSISQNRSLQEFSYWKAWKYNFMNIWFTCASTLCRLIVMIKFTWCIKLPVIANLGSKSRIQPSSNWLIILSNWQAENIIDCKQKVAYNGCTGQPNEDPCHRPKDITILCVQAISLNPEVYHIETLSKNYIHVQMSKSHNVKEFKL